MKAIIPTTLFNLEFVSYQIKPNMNWKHNMTDGQSTATEQTFHLEDVIDYFESCFYLIILFLTNECEETGI